MPYAGNVYTVPPGTEATTATPIDSSDYNAFVDDIEAAQNAARPIVAGGTGAVTAALARAALGLAIGTDVQAFSAVLATLTGATANGQSLVTAANYAAMRTLLGLVIGTDVQAQGATLTALEALSLVAGDLLYATGADTPARLAKGTASQVLRMNAGATAPEWQTDAALALLTATTWAVGQHVLGYRNVATAAVLGATMAGSEIEPCNSDDVPLRDTALSGTAVLLGRIGSGSGDIRVSNFKRVA